jgi:hypothetical protein
MKAATGLGLRQVLAIAGLKIQCTLASVPIGILNLASLSKKVLDKAKKDLTS